MSDQKYLVNRMAVIRMIDDPSRRLLMRPRTLVRGVIRGYKPRSPLNWEFKAQDFLASLVGPASPEKQIPPEAISRVQFPKCPPDAIGKPVPIIYGRLTGSGDISALAPPILQGDPADGFYTHGGYAPGNILLGYGPQPSDADPVTGIIVTLNGAASGELSSNVQNAEYGFAVTAVDASGRESDPVAYYWNGPGEGRGSFAVGPLDSVVVPDDTRSITVSWTGSAGAVSYRCYIWTFYYVARSIYYMEVDDPTTTVTFDKHPQWQEFRVTSDMITTGGTFCNWYSRPEYAVTAIASDGETGMSAWAIGSDSAPMRRPVRVEWLPVVGADSYRVYRRQMFGQWDRYWEVAGTETFFDDDQLDTNVIFIETSPTLQGTYKPIWVGEEADDFGFVWQSFLICGHQIGGIINLFQDNIIVDTGNYGVTILAPGEAGYSSYFAGHAGTPQYKEVNGRRYSMLYMRGPQGHWAASGEKPVSMNVSGRLDATDGDVITALTDIYKDFIINWGFQDSGGDHLQAPDWPTDLDDRIVSQIDETSFDTVKAVHDARLSGGYPGAIAFGAEGNFQRLRECIAQLNLSCDCKSGFNRNSQFFICIFDESLAILDAALEYTQLHDIIKETFDAEARTDLIENVVVYNYGRKYNLAQVQVRTIGDIPTGDPEFKQENPWIGNLQEIRDEEAITNLRETRKSQELNLWAVRSVSVAYDIASRRLLYYKDPPMEITLETNLRGLSTELGDIIKVTHLEGMSNVGWSLQPLRVMRHVVNPSQYKVTLVCVDVARLYAGTGTFGDEDLLDPSWATASDTERQYFYLCDETTGLFSDGAEGKRLR